MKLFKINRQFLPKLAKFPQYSTAVQKNEYTSKPHYPEILDLSLPKRKERLMEAEHEEFKGVKTVEEKQIKLNMPRFYGFKCYMLREEDIPYDNLTLTQHVTKTHIIKSETLPEFYGKMTGEVVGLKEDIEEGILLEIDGYQKAHDLKKEEMDKVDRENLITTSIVKQVNRSLVNRLSRNNSHLQDIQLDLSPRIESFWFCGGIVPPENVRKSRLGQEWSKEHANDPVDRALQYIGSPILSLRSTKPLKPLIPLNECENPDFSVPFWKYDPGTVGIFSERRHIVNVPGFWPGNPYEFGLISYHKIGHFLNRCFDDNCEALDRQGILASFGWLLAQANFMGFNTFNDLTYPLVTQTVLTNGQKWSFYCYQLNTIKVHYKHITENPKKNICWSLPELKLFEEVKDGKLIGFNEEVVKILVKMYQNTPEISLGLNLKPYLSKEQVIANYEDDEKREWLEGEYKKLVSNRPRRYLDYEIYHWEKIYKIDNKTRFMDKKMRPFELRQNPYKRRLNDRPPRYIPKCFRPDLPKYKGRFAKTYFP